MSETESVDTEGLEARIEPCEEVPGIESLDPGTRLKTHILRMYALAADGTESVLWERSFFTHYENHEAYLHEECLFFGWDDKVVVLDPSTAKELENYNMYLFEEFWDAGESRVLCTEKGAIYLFDARGQLLWLHGGSEILDSVIIHDTGHLFVHYWEGVLLEGLRVPFAPLDLETGQLDLAGPVEGPFAFEDLVDPDQVGGPISQEDRERLRSNLTTLGERHPDPPWIRAALEYLASS